MPIILPFPPFSVLGLSQTRHFKKLLITEPSARSTMGTFGSHVVTSLTHQRETNDMVHVPHKRPYWLKLKFNWQVAEWSKTEAIVTLYPTALAPTRKPHRTGLLFTHTNGDFGAISLTARSCGTPVFESGSSHIGKVYPTLSRNVNWYSDRSVSKWGGARTGIDWDESEHLEKRTGI